MRNMGTREIETDRLLLRRFTLNDTYAMYNNWAGDEEVTSHYHGILIKVWRKQAAIFFRYARHIRILISITGRLR